MHPFDLSQKTILITGASSGIGRQTAITLASLGARCIITGRNEEQLDHTLSRMSGANHYKIQADLCQEEDLKKLVNEVEPLDGVVFSAGIVKVLPFRFINKPDLKNIYETNFEAPIFLLQSIIKAKKLQRKAAVLFISSISGVKVGLVANGMYSASKAALSGITKTLALELAPQQIRVNTLAPGMVRTEMISDGVIAAVSTEALSEDEKLYPLGYGDVNDVANTIAFLMSNASKWITGTDIIIDGGYSCK